MEIEAVTPGGRSYSISPPTERSDDVSWWLAELDDSAPPVENPELEPWLSEEVPYSRALPTDSAYYYGG